MDLSAGWRSLPTYPNLTTSEEEVWWGSTHWLARSPWWGVEVSRAGDHFHTLTLPGGGDKSVPVSLALFWVIRATSGTAAGQTPAAAICAFGADVSTNPPAGWLYCNGMPQARGSSSSAFADTIGSNFGGDGVSTFNLPDLRGQFVRATNHNTRVDPDVQTRYAYLPGGNTGDAVGSAQSFATADAGFVMDAAGEHVHGAKKVPNYDFEAAEGATAPNAIKWGNTTNTTSAGQHTHRDFIGGDLETRPDNIYLDWIIANDVIPDAPPIGTLMAYGGDVTLDENYEALKKLGWAPCIGLKVLKKDPQYQALYQVIGGIYGEGNLDFSLPDLRGYFVIGAGGDRPIGNLLTASLTGQPATQFATTTDGNHTHKVDGLSGDSHKSDSVAGHHMANLNENETASSKAGSHTHALSSGGDAETRPVNVYVDYVIRYK